MGTARGRKAWLITIECANPGAHKDFFDRIEPGSVLAVLPPRTGIDKVILTVDALLQAYLWTDPDSRIRFLTPVDQKRPETAYARAQRAGWGQQVMGGTNPYIEAFRVEDLRTATDPETGETKLEYTRKPPTPPPDIR